MKRYDAKIKLGLNGSFRVEFFASPSGPFVLAADADAELAAACGCRTFDQNLIECEYHAAQSDELRAARAKIRELETANLPLYSDRIKDLEKEITRLRELVEAAYCEGVVETMSNPDFPKEWPQSIAKAALDGGKE